MDEELKGYLAGQFETQRKDTREGFHEVHELVAKGIHELREDTRQQIFHLREDTRQEILQVREDMRQIETNLLTAFHNWARPMEIRQ